MDELKRRDFLRATGGVAAGIAATGAGLAPAVAAPKRKGPNDTIRCAVLGVRSRGLRHVEHWSKIKNVEVATLCDVDEAMFGKALEAVAKAGKPRPRTEMDLRRVFDDKSIDFVSIATPDHWHALATIWACQAGKDVFVEKPTSHGIWEGRKMVEAAKKYGRVVQAGTQNRSITNVQNAIKALRDGAIGDVYMAKGLCYKARDTIGKKPDGPVPKGVNYDLWLGPAPLRPFNENRFHYNWHWFWDYGCTDLGNQGPHQMDIARWGLGRTDYPVRTHCVGGYFAFDSDQETPNTQLSTMEFADGKILQFEVRGLYTNADDGIKIGNLFFGTKGWMHVNGPFWQTYLGRKNEKGPGSGEIDTRGADPADLAGSGDFPHFENFVAAVRAGKPSLLNGTIEDGHVSSTYCHLANIAYRVGRVVKFDGKTETFPDDPEASAHLRRNYRAPYVVPDQV